MASESVGEGVREQLESLQSNEILFLENCRFHAEETVKDLRKRNEYAKQLADLADIYVNDAFGAVHREHASIVNVSNYISGVCGFLVQREVDFLSTIERAPQRPYIAVLGGAKVSDKLPFIRSFLERGR